MALACVNVDLDSLSHYCNLYGLPPSMLSPGAVHAVCREALPRFCELFDQAGVRATFFAVGKDLDDAPSAQALREACAAGHEAGNHTFDHDYALTRKAPGTIGDDVARGSKAIERVVGSPPVGFRAPGYTLTAPLVRALVEQGFRYDSSAFPAAPYWALKAGVMGALAALGRESRAILDRPRVLLAPRLPYHPSLDEPYQAGQSELVELPISVHPLTRVPLIGAAITGLPPAAFGLLWRGVAGLPFLNVELHGIDLLDAADVSCPELVAGQRDLAVPISTKRARLKAMLRRMTDGFEVVTLAVASQRVAS